jgi:DivIVA domain-containing protein
VARSDSVERDETDSEPAPGSAEQGEDSMELRHAPAEIRDVSFPLSVRGYDREAVDAYVARVNDLIAELEISRSPQAAVKHALEQVAEQTRGLLERAGQTAEEITLEARREAEENTTRAKAAAEEIVAKAQAEANEVLGRSKAEAETMTAQAREEAAERLQRSQDEVAAVEEKAQARMRELQADTETIRQQRRALLDDLRQIGAHVAETASNADVRFPPQPSSASPEEETLDFEGDSESGETSVAAADQPHDGNAGRQARPGDRGLS